MGKLRQLFWSKSSNSWSIPAQIPQQPNVSGCDLCWVGRESIEFLWPLISLRWLGPHRKWCETCSSENSCSPTRSRISSCGWNAVQRSGLHRSFSWPLPEISRTKRGVVTPNRNCDVILPQYALIDAIYSAKMGMSGILLQETLTLRTEKKITIITHRKKKTQERKKASLHRMTKIYISKAAKFDLHTRLFENGRCKFWKIGDRTLELKKKMLKMFPYFQGPTGCTMMHTMHKTSHVQSLNFII